MDGSWTTARLSLHEVEGGPDPHAVPGALLLLADGPLPEEQTSALTRCPP